MKTGTPTPRPKFDGVPARVIRADERLKDRGYDGLYYPGECACLARVTPDQLSRVEQADAWESLDGVLRLGTRDDDGFHAAHDGDVFDLVSALLREREALRAALEGMLAALSSPEDDEGLCAAHGEEMDLCDACLLDRQRRRRAAADVARALLTGTTARTEGK